MHASSCWKKPLIALFWGFFLLIAITPIKTINADDLIARELANAELVGSARLTYFFWHIYDAELYASDGNYSEQNNAALKLTYLRTLYGDKIAERSVDEIFDLGFEDEQKLEQWGRAMAEIFPDVADGDHLISIYRPNSATDFFQNGKKIGTVSDPDFGLWFFRIWLSADSSEPEMRNQLLNLN